MNHLSLRIYALRTSLTASVLCLLLVTIGLGVADAQGAANDFASVPCSPLDGNSRHRTPVDLYRVVAACGNAARYDIAIDAFALAGTYGKFDMARVSDQSAYGVLGAMKNLALNSMPESNRAQFQRIAGHNFDDKAEHDGVCQRMRKIGPPSYHPSYMLNHGLGAVLEATGASSPSNSSALRTDFVPQEAWNKALADYFSCK